MPVVTIKIAGTLHPQGAGRGCKAAEAATAMLTREQKQKVAEEITATLERHAGKPASYTYIVFEELPHENWAIAGQLLDDD